MIFGTARLSQLVERGVQVKVIQKLMGHQDLKTTLRYAHPREGMLEDAMALLGPQLDKDAQPEEWVKLHVVEQADADSDVSPLAAK